VQAHVHQIDNLTHCLPYQTLPGEARFTVRALGTHTHHAAPWQDLQQHECLNGIDIGGVGRVNERDDEKSDAKDGHGVAEDVGFGEEKVVCEPDGENLGIDSYSDSDAVDLVVAFEATSRIRDNGGGDHMVDDVGGRNGGTRDIHERGKQG
jgi:hypothetical protein